MQIRRIFCVPNEVEHLDLWFCSVSDRFEAILVQQSKKPLIFISISVSLFKNWIKHRVYLHFWWEISVITSTLCLGTSEADKETKLWRSNRLKTQFLFQLMLRLHFLFSSEIFGLRETRLSTEKRYPRF